MCPFPGTTQIPFQFQGGIKSDIADVSLDQPFLQSAENAVTSQLGQLDKRTGFTAVPRNIMTGGQLSQGKRVTTFNDELIVFDGTTLYSYQDEEQVWINRGLAFSTVNDQQRILNTKIATQSNPDTTTSANISVYAWEDNRNTPGFAASKGVRYSVINQDTNTFIISDQIAFSYGTRPKVITDGYNFYLLCNGSAHHIFYQTIPVDKPNTTSGQFTQVTDQGYSSVPGTASIAYDAMIFIPRTPANQPGKLLTVVATTAGVILNNYYIGTITVDTNPAVTCIATCTDINHNAWVVYSDASKTYCTAYNYNSLTSSWVQLFTPVVVQSTPSANIGISGDKNRGSLNITCEVVNAPLNNFCNNYTVTNKGTVTLVGQIRSVGLVSKPFLSNNNVFVNVINAAVLQATYFTICLSQGIGFIPGTSSLQAINNSTLQTDFTVVSKHSPTNGGNYRNNNILSQCDPIQTGEYLFAGQRKGPFESFNSSQSTTLGVAGYFIGFNNTNPYQTVSSNNNLHICGGVKKIYDGISCVEDNFHLFPELPDGFGCDLSVRGGGGNLSYNSLTPDAQYQYIVVYEWSDNYTQVYRSGPSVANGFIPTQAGQSVLLIVPTLRLTDKVAPRSPIAISIYRTILNGTIFYKITNDNDPIVNDTTVDTLTFLDTASDVSIQSNENLYTGSQLGNTAPPPCSLISLYQNRLMINSNEDPTVLWYTQNKFDLTQYNTLPLDFNTSFVEGVDSRLGKDITAIGLLDNALAIFKKTSIFILQGDGPNALDTSSGFNDAQLIVSDTGCSNPDSLVFLTQTPKTPGGLMFKSDKGIYLLGRDQSLYFIGAPVKKYNYLTINGANLLAESNQIVFTSNEGICLVYNYYFDCWSTWTGLPCVASTVWKNQLVLLLDNGGVMIQSGSNGTIPVYVDTFPNGVQHQISLKFITPWIKFTGLQGYMCCYNVLLLGTYQSPHVMTCEVAFDLNPSISETASWNSTLAANRWGGLPVWGNDGQWGASGIFSNYQFQINFQNFRSQAIQLTFSDNNPEYTQGYSLNSLVFEVNPLSGGMRVPNSNKVATKRYP